MLVTNITNSGLRVNLKDGSVLNLPVSIKAHRVPDELITDELHRYAKLRYILLEEEPVVVEEPIPEEVEAPVSAPVEIKKTTTKKSTTTSTAETTSASTKSKGVKTNE